MKTAASFIVCLIFATSAFSQTKNWKQLPGPYVGSTLQVEVAQDSILYVLSAMYASGQVKLYYRGPDKQWHPSNLPYNFVADGSSQYAKIATERNGALLLFNTSKNSSTTNPTGIYRSTDKGKTWNRVLTNAFISAIHQSSGTGNLYAFKGGTYITYTAIFRSQDHGITWDSLTAIPLVSMHYLVDNSDRCYFSLYNSNQIGVVRYDAPTNLYKAITTNLTASANNNPTIAFCKGKLCIRSDSSFFILKSDDSWERTGSVRSSLYSMILVPSQLYSTSSGNLYMPCSTDTNDGFFQIMTSSDLGRSWRLFSPNLPNILSTANYSVISFLKFASDSGGTEYLTEAYYSHTPTIYQSTTAGASWKPIGVPNTQIRLIQEAPQHTIYALNYYTSYSSGRPYYYPISGYLSSDGGQSWEDPSNRFTDLHWSMGSFTKAADGSFFFFKDSSYVRSIWYADKSTPDKFELSSSTFNPTLPLSSASLNNKTFMILNGELMWTTDKGVTWEAIATPITGPGLYSFSIESKGTIYIGYAPAMYKSTDEGMSWIKVLTPIKNAPISFIKFPDAQSIVVGTQGDGLWRSTNSGLTWDLWSPPGFDTITGIEIIGPICYVGTNKGLITCQLSTNNWHNELFVEENQPILQLFRSDSGYVYASVPDNGIWTNNPNIAILRQHTNTASERLGLKIEDLRSIYPQVTFTIDTYEQVTIELYDLLGHKVLTLANDRFAAGEHSILIPTGSLANGMYHIILKTTMGIVSKKWLLSR